MDEAYTGGVGGGGAESGDEGESTSRDETDALFADLLKDENEGLPVCPVTFSARLKFCL